MFKTVARIVTRFQGKEDGLFLGTLLKGGQEYFKPNTIYEIQDIMGVLTNVEVGRATGAGDNNCASRSMSEGKTQFHWGGRIDRILEVMGKYLFLTEEEHESI